MDLKKEIKLSDLVPKRKPKAPKDGAEPVAGEKKEKKAKKPLLKREFSFKRKPKQPRAEGEDEKPKKERKRRGSSGPKRAKAKKLVGLKIGGSQLAAARIANNGVPELVQVARERLEHGIVVGGELRCFVGIS